MSNRQERRRQAKKEKKDFEQRLGRVKNSTLSPLVKSRLGIEEAQRMTTKEILGEGKTGEKVIELVANATGFAQGMIDATYKATGQSPKLACRAGCVFCCYDMVELTAAEVIVALDHLRTNLSPEYFAALHKRIVETDEDTRGLDADARFALRRPCPLLDGGRCLAYKARPLACRGWNSTDAEACKAALDNPDQTITVETSAVQWQYYMGAGKGIADGLGEAGLQGDRLELVAALRLAIEEPEAADRWLQGEPVFAPAKAADNTGSTRAQANKASIMGLRV